jgi:hypothetical protein
MSLVCVLSSVVVLSKDSAPGHGVDSMPMVWVGFRIWNISLDKVACQWHVALQTLKSQNLSHNMLAVMKFISRYG